MKNQTEGKVTVGVKNVGKVAIAVAGLAATAGAALFIKKRNGKKEVVENSEESAK